MRKKIFVLFVSFFLNYCSSDIPDVSIVIPDMSSEPPPCPNDTKFEINKRLYAPFFLLAEHPNKECSRDWVCTPISDLSIDYPLCEWRIIRRGDESLTVWLHLNAANSELLDIPSIEFSGPGIITRTTFRTGVWEKYIDPGAYRTNTVIVETLSVSGDNYFERLRFCNDRTFKREMCPRMYGNEIKGINCGPWKILN